MPAPAPATHIPAEILLDRPGPGVARLTLNRAERKNAMTYAMWDGLGAAVEALSEEPELRAIVLAGAGGVFCAGADISEFAEVRGDAEAARRYERAVNRANLSLRDSPKAVFAAVSGPAMGGGCGLALCCDFRIADRTAYFGIPAAKLSIVYSVTETRALLEAVGPARAREVLFTARRYPAEDALKIGMATSLVDGDATEAALEAASELAGSAPLTIGGAKAVLGALGPRVSDADLARVLAWQDRAAASEDYREGQAAFRERRAPVFRGR